MHTNTLTCLAFSQTELMASLPSGHFHFQSVELYESEQIGAGSYGIVCKAKCDELPCAAKILRPIFFQGGDPGARLLVERFEEECVLLSGIKHPHIVQYLGTYRHPQSGLPVLLMEILDESLTAFLERSSSPLVCNIQVDLCHDIALALVYLHANGIIHRDLSSNNVLLLAGCRAKVTDFGMSKFIKDGLERTPLTQCPGCVAYMAPEALSSPFQYTEKLDVFSFGVLTVQILTRKFPDPDAPSIKVNDPKYPTGTIQVPVPEIERRKTHISSIHQSDPLLPIALCCLEYSDSRRPTSKELCNQLGALKASLPPPQSQSLEVSSIKDELQLAKEEVVRLRDENQELAHEVSKSQQPPSPSASENCGSGTGQLKWSSCKKVPCRMFRGAAAAAGNIMYINPNGTKVVYEFDPENQLEAWSALPDCTHTDFGLAIVNQLVTTVGGDRSHSEPTNVLVSLVRGNRWSKYFPPMPTKRFEPAVACSNHLLVVAGGKTELGGGRLCTVEVMDTITRQWHSAGDLPVAVSGMSMTIAGERIHLLGGFDQRGASTSVFSCTLSALRRSFRRSIRAVLSRQGLSRRRNIWQAADDIPVYYSTCTSVNEELIAVGGLDSHRRPTAAVRRYDAASNSWRIIGEMPTARYDCLVSVLSGNRLIVVGGCASSSWGSWTDVVEMSSL